MNLMMMLLYDLLDDYVMEVMEDKKEVLGYYYYYYYLKNDLIEIFLMMENWRMNEVIFHHLMKMDEVETMKFEVWKRKEEEEEVMVE